MTAGIWTAQARGKVNLTLRVLARRADGYHDLDSLVVFASDVGDILTLKKAERDEVEVVGPFADRLMREGGDSAIARARDVARKAGGRTAPVHIRLEKHLPVAAGLGGGTADAAATLRLMGEASGQMLQWNNAGLVDALGADVPACLASVPLRMRARGEEITAISRMPECHGVLVNPGVQLSTAAVFAGVTPQPRADTAPHAFDDFEALVAHLADDGNDLQAPACRLAPVISDVLNALSGLPGVAVAVMSGSGASCVGLTPGRAYADIAASMLANAHPQWWVRAATFVDGQATA